jgi:NADH-ubiquinone oxidoreductase chain 5
MSQLGMMVIAIGLSSYTIALFHLINHAFYKGLLFLCAGAVIHAVADNQDFRKYGGLVSYLPLTYSLMLTASLSLVAFPFMTGFYSKDFILESAYGQYKLSSIIIYFIATIGAMFTTLYSVKVLYLTFLTNPNGSLVNYKLNKSAHEGDVFMSTPLVILGLFSIFFGYITKDLFIGLGSDFFSDNALFIHPHHELMLDTEFAVNTFYKLLPLFFTITLTICSIALTEFYPRLLVGFKLSRFGYNIFSFFNQRFLVEMYYNRYISGTVLNLGGQTTKVLDKGAVELFGPFGLEQQFTNLSKKIDSLSTGIVTNYALYILIGLISYISVINFNEFNIFIIIHALIILTIEDKKFLNSKHDSHDFVSLPLQSVAIPSFSINGTFFFLIAGFFIVNVLPFLPLNTSSDIIPLLEETRHLVDQIDNLIQIIASPSTLLTPGQSAFVLGQLQVIYGLIIPDLLANVDTALTNPDNSALNIRDLDETRDILTDCEREVGRLIEDLNNDMDTD